MLQGLPEVCSVAGKFTINWHSCAACAPLIHLKSWKRWIWGLNVGWMPLQVLIAHELFSLFLYKDNSDDEDDQPERKRPRPSGVCPNIQWWIPFQVWVFMILWYSQFLNSLQNRGICGVGTLSQSQILFSSQL